MERTHKRPRLAAPIRSNHHYNDSELEDARNRNNMLLKTQFEGIFKKYGQDFEGIGDEIDLVTGRIVVDNGHVMGMQDEQDVGHYGNKSRFDSGSLLRALTAPPDDCDVPLSSVEAGDEFIEVPVDHGQDWNTLKRPRSDDEDSLLGSVIDPRDAESEDSESDDSFIGRTADDKVARALARREETYSSSGSAFTDDEENSSDSGESFLGTSLESHDHMDKAPGGRELHEHPTDAGIMKQFGEELGPQVIEVLKKRHAALEASIEPEWRVPDIGETFRSPKGIDHPRIEVDDARSASPAQSKSIWAPLRRHQRGKNERSSTLESGLEFRPSKERKSSYGLDPQYKSTLSRASIDSDDPLQEDFSASPQQASNSSSPNAVGATIESPAGKSKAILKEEDQQCPFCLKCYTTAVLYSHLSWIIKREKADGIHDKEEAKHFRSTIKVKMSREKDRQCPFCLKSFTATGLGHHLDHMLKRKRRPDNIHDLEEIRIIRSAVTRTLRKDPRSFSVQSMTSNVPHFEPPVTAAGESMSPSRKGRQCPFCIQSFRTANDLGRHLDRILSRKIKNDVHDIEQIKRMRSTVTRRYRRRSSLQNLDPDASGAESTDTEPHRFVDAVIHSNKERNTSIVDGEVSYSVRKDSGSPGQAGKPYNLQTPLGLRPKSLQVLNSAPTKFTRSRFSHSGNEDVREGRRQSN